MKQFPKATIYTANQTYCLNVPPYSSPSSTTTTANSSSSNNNDKIVFGQDEIYIVYRMDQEQDRYNWSIKQICSCHSTRKKALIACLHYWNAGRSIPYNSKEFLLNIKTLPKYLQFETLDYLNLHMEVTDVIVECKTQLAKELKELTVGDQRPQLEEMSESEIEEIIKYLAALEEDIEVKEGEYGEVYVAEKMNLH